MPPKAKPAPKAAPEPKAKPKAAPKPAAKKEKKEKPEEEQGPKIPVVEKPDVGAWDEKIAAVNTEIDKLQKKQAEIAKKISDRSTGKEEFFKQKSEIRAQLDEFATKINGLTEQKDKILKSVGEKREEGRQARTDLNKLKKSIGFTSEAEIDDRIANIEFKLWTDSVSLKDEKKMLAEIQELKRNRPKVSMVNKKEGELQNLDSGLSMKEQITEINAQLGVLRDGRRTVSDKLTAIMEDRNKKLGDLGDVISEREELSKGIQEQIKTRNDLRDEKRAAERQYNDYLAEVRKWRQEKANEERAARQAEYALQKRKRQAEQLDEQPFVSEMTLIEQTLLFCRTLTQVKGEEKKVETKEIAHNNPDGTEILLKKEDRDEFYFNPTKGKKGKSKAKASGESGGKKPIKHNAETFQLFDKLKLNAPITTDDVPALIEELEKQYESYKLKVKDWEEKREERKRKILEGLEEEEEKAEEKAEEEKPAEEEKAEAEAEEEKPEEEEKEEEKEEEAEEKAEEEAEEKTED